MPRFTGTCTGTYGDRYNLYLDCTLNSQNTAQNKSNVTVRMWARSTSTDYYAHNLYTVNPREIKVDGKVVVSGNISIDLRNRKVAELGSWTGDVSHNSDGKKTVNVSGSFEIKNVSSLSGGSVSGSWELTTIRRASSIESFPNFTVGDDFTVDIDRYSSDFTHDLTLKVGTTTIKTVSGIGKSYKFSLNTTEQDKIYTAAPSSNKATVTLNCQTKSGSTNIGSVVSKTATATIPNNDTTKPNFNTITYSEAVGDVASLIGSYVSGLSRLNLTITDAIANKGASIKAYQITFDGNTYAKRTATSNVINSSGELTITGKVTDTRDFSRSKSVTVNVLSYTVPQITKFMIERCDIHGNVNDVGEYALATIAGNISGLDGSNNLTYKVRSRQRGLNVWTTQKEETLTGVTSISDSVIIGTFAPTLSYDFRFEIIDEFKTTFTLDTLSTGKVILSWDDEGVGVGKVREQGVLDVGGDAYADNFFTTSNKASKTDIMSVDLTTCYDLMKDLQFKTYQLKSEIDKSKIYGSEVNTYMGLISDDAPEVISNNCKSGINLYPFISLIGATVQELQKRLEAVEKKIIDSEGDITLE